MEAGSLLDLARLNKKGDTLSEAVTVRYLVYTCWLAGWLWKGLDKTGKNLPEGTLALW
jgi:hypothetical protein